MTMEETAVLAFRTLQQPVRITKVPLPIASAGVSLYRMINRKRADLGLFFVRSGSLHFHAPSFGTHRLANDFRNL
jgi:hypothetical protein